MESNEIPQITPVPGVIKAIKEGCNLAANKAYLLLIPLVLDLFLLFGPKLRIDQYFNPLFNIAFQQMPATLSNSQRQQLELAADMAAEAIESVNLLGFVQTFPVGVRVLFSASGNTSPLGTTPEIQILSAIGILLIIFAMLGFGVLLGTIYYSLTAAAARINGKFSWGSFGKQLLNVIVMLVAMIVALFIIMVPFACIMTFIYMLVPFLYRILIFLAMVIACWLVVPLFYIPHGIFMENLDFPHAVRRSLDLGSWSGPITVRYILFSMLISLGMDMIWTIPAQSSWLILVSIFGHAFVSTALLASSFILFRELSIWQTENRSFLEWRKANLRFRHIIRKQTQKENDTND